MLSTEDSNFNVNRLAVRMQIIYHICIYNNNKKYCNQMRNLLLRFSIKNAQNMNTREGLAHIGSK